MPDNLHTNHGSPEPSRDPRDMTLVEIAGELESITAAIEQERAREREARTEYESIAEDVQAKVRVIRDRAKWLVEEQRRRISGFDGMLSPGKNSGAPLTEIKPNRRRTMPDAILAIWTDGGYDVPLTTEQIAQGLEEIGYQSKAAPRSLKSSINQTIARLCKSGQLLKYRADGTPLQDTDGVRARRYLPADHIATLHA